MDFTPGTPLAQDGKAKHQQTTVQRRRRRLAGEPPRKKGRPKGTRNMWKKKKTVNKRLFKAKVRKRKARLTAKPYVSKAKKPRKASVWDRINEGFSTSGQATTPTTLTTIGTNTDATPFIPVNDIQTTRPRQPEPMPLAVPGAPRELPVIIVTPVPLPVPAQAPRPVDHPPSTKAAAPAPTRTTPHSSGSSNSMFASVQSSGTMSSSTPSTSPTGSVQQESTSQQVTPSELVQNRPKPKSIDIPSVGKPSSPPNAPGLSEQALPPTINVSVKREPSVQSRPKSVEIPGIPAASISSLPNPNGSPSEVNTAKPNPEIVLPEIVGHEPSTSTNTRSKPAMSSEAISPSSGATPPLTGTSTSGPNISAQREPNSRVQSQQKIETVPKMKIAMPPNGPLQATTVPSSATPANVTQAEQNVIFVQLAPPSTIAATANQNTTTPRQANPDQMESSDPPLAPPKGH